MRYPENGRYEENDYIAFASASFRQKKTQKAFRGLSRLQSGTIFQVLWHNPAYHYVENKWRCSGGCLGFLNHQHYQGKAKIQNKLWLQISQIFSIKHLKYFRDNPTYPMGKKT